MSDRQDVLRALEGKTAITADDVVAMRRVIFGDMSVSRDEADAIVRINAGVREADPAWRMLYTEVLTDYLVRQEEPSGYVDRTKADWLIDRLTAGGRAPNAGDLDMVVYVLERAWSAPSDLALFAMKQVARLALDPDRADGKGPALTADEVSLIRRALYAFAGAGGAAAVSRDEAEFLFDLNDAARGLPNDPSWTDLFAKAIGAAIMAAPGYAPPTREQEVATQAWLESDGDGVASFLSRSLNSLIGKSKPEPDPWEAHNRETDAAIAAAAPVTAEEAGWMLDRVGRDGVLDDNERALLTFVKDNADAVPAAVLQKLNAA